MRLGQVLDDVFLFHKGPNLSLGRGLIEFSRKHGKVVVGASGKDIAVYQGGIRPMNSIPPEGSVLAERRYEDLIYIRQVLGELRGIAAKHQEKMICYLIDMAYHETMDTLQGDGNTLVGQR